MSYVNNGLSPQSMSFNLKHAFRCLRPIRTEFDSIACTGVSGVMFAPLLAFMMKKQLIVVRKPGVSSHAPDKVECTPGFTPTNYIIVDDFIASGKTIFTVYDEITRPFPRSSLRGVFLWNTVYNRGTLAHQGGWNRVLHQTVLTNGVASSRNMEVRILTYYPEITCSKCGRNYISGYDRCIYCSR